MKALKVLEFSDQTDIFALRNHTNNLASHVRTHIETTEEVMSLG